MQLYGFQVQPSLFIKLTFLDNYFTIRTLTSKINMYERLFLSIAMMLIGVNVALSIYAAFILPYILKVKEDIEEYNP